MPSNIVGVYDSFSIFRYVYWDSQQDFEDLSDLVKSEQILYAFENNDDMSCLVFSTFNKQYYFADSLYEAIDNISEEINNGKIICGLSQSVMDQDEDGIFEVLESNGGHIDFISEFDDPRQISDEGHAVLYFKCNQNIIHVLKKTEGFDVVMNGTGPMHINEVAGYAEADETRSIIYYNYS